MREYIGYHSSIGVDKFFIYHNYGSTGNDNRATGNSTKYGIGLQCFGYNDEKKREQLGSIVEDFEEHIIYIPWQARRPTG